MIRIQGTKLVFLNPRQASSPLCTSFHPSFYLERTLCIDVVADALREWLCGQTGTSDFVKCPRRARVWVRNLLQSQPSSPWEIKLLFSVFSEVFIIPRFASVFHLSSSLFHTLTSTICCIPSVFFHRTLCDSFRLSFYLFHADRDRFIYFSLFPKPDAQSLAYRRCF